MAIVIGDLRAVLGLDSAAFQKGLAQAGSSLRGAGKQMQRIGAGMSASLTAPLSVIGGLSLKAAGDFEAAMNKVKAATGASAGEFKSLRDAAIKMGSTTQFSASQSAEAIEVLAKNGLKSSQILGGALTASMQLAAASGTDLATAGDIATDVMLSFGKQAGDLTGLVDGMTGVLLVSKFGIDDYRMALAQAGGVAGGLGVEFEDFNVAIAATSNLFSSGSDAGTSFKTFLQRLVPASAPAAKKIRELGLEFFDAQGNMKSMADIAQELQDGLAGLSEEAKNDALSTIFGNDALRTAIGLSQQGADGIARLNAEIGKASASDQAKARMEGFNGAMLELKSAIEGLQIAIGDSGLIETMTGLVKRVTEFVSELSRTNPEILKWGLMIGAVAAAIGPVLLGLGVLLSGIAPVVSAIGVLAGAAAAIGAPFIAAAAAIAGVVAAIYLNWDAVGPWFMDLFRSIGDMFMGLVKVLAGIVTGDMALAVEGLKQAWGGLQAFFQTLWDGVVAVFVAAWEKIKPVVDKVSAAVTAITSGRDRITGVVDGPISSGAYTGGATGPITPPPVYSDHLTGGLAGGTAGMAEQGAADAGAYDKGFRDRMGIHSPSRVMMDVGQYLSQGLGQGIAAGEGYVSGATNHVGAAVTDGFMGRFGEITRGADSLSDVWDNMKNSFAAALQDMAGALWKSGLSSLLTSVIGGVDPLAGALRGTGLPAIPAFATGVQNFRGGWARINELGGELVKLPGGSTVVPHDLSRDMVSNSPRDVRISVGVDPRDGSIAPYVDHRADAIAQSRVAQSDAKFPTRWAQTNKQMQERFG